MKENNDGNIPFYIGLAVFFIFAVLGITYMVQNSNSYDERGTFGDMFGFANAAFTGLSVVGLIATILLQRNDINIQRKELQKQAELIQSQNFENTFFQMMNLFYKVIEQIFYSDGTNKFSGKTALSNIHYALLKSAQKYNSEKQELGYVDYSVSYFAFTGDEIRSLIRDHFDLHKNQLSHYYRTLFSIISLIDSSPIVNKNIYINILTSQLSRTELMLLLYYGIYSDNESHLNFIEKYSLLKDLDRSKLVYPSMTGAYTNQGW
ncbi:Putative phage abortive infection protein [Chryseobacterium carnipullorum]|uniref:putative phage abortive infection protein n=1 Tax=Chryseobacterium carnipullorum TaxID=1124835 RepID=UPI00091FDB27|nr:putative phage abortive infection protein [Chryseobacterium carnipullorum]SHM93641.1 Putative phage abortive infection protein [Chryseobacterium carnipullorum]